MKPETKIVNQIQQYVELHNGNVLKLYGNAVQRSNEPDLIGGIIAIGMPGYVHFAVEVKVPGQEARPGQRYRLGKWASVGFKVGVAHSLEEFIGILNG